MGCFLLKSLEYFSALKWKSSLNPARYRGIAHTEKAEVFSAYICLEEQCHHIGLVYVVSKKA